MRTALAVLLGFLLTVIEGTWTASGIPPADIMLVVAIHLGLTRSPFGGAVAAFFAGYLVDLTTGCPKGLTAGQVTIAFFLSHLLTGRFLVRGIVVEALFTLVVAILTSLYASLLLTWIPVRAMFPAPSVVSVLIHVGITCAVAPLVFALLRGIDSLFERPKSRLVLR